MAIEGVEELDELELVQVDPPGIDPANEAALIEAFNPILMLMNLYRIASLTVEKDGIDAKIKVTYEPGVKRGK